MDEQTKYLMSLLAMFPSDLHPINSQLFGMSILTSNLRFIATCFLSISPTATLQNAD